MHFLLLYMEKVELVTYRKNKSIKAHLTFLFIMKLLCTTFLRYFNDVCY